MISKMKEEGVIMHQSNRVNWLTASFLGLMLPYAVNAGDVNILAADFRQNTDSSWSVGVTLKHTDTGWDHYADRWQVEDEQGNSLGYRLLMHPHVNQQPFTRRLVGLSLPKEITTVYIRAHDKVHGWTKTRLKVDLKAAKQGYIRVESRLSR